jgi:hypothetical protein
VAHAFSNAVVFCKYHSLQVLYWGITQCETAGGSVKQAARDPASVMPPASATPLELPLLDVLPPLAAPELEPPPEEAPDEPPEELVPASPTLPDVEEELEGVELLQAETNATKLTAAKIFIVRSYRPPSLMSRV